MQPLLRIPAPPEHPLTQDEERYVEALIARLADIANPDYGLSPTMTGFSFAPVPNSDHIDAMLLTAHNLKQSSALVKLVKIGPRALPLLLKHLDDPTPTKLTIKHEFGIGGMGLADELDFNEANPLEQRLRSRGRDYESDLFKHPLTSYQVKVGDVCFNAIGQIVGRRYLAVRYQPTAIIVINSPVADPSLARMVTETWTSSTPTALVLRSLLTDYSCRGVYSGYSLDAWDIGSRLQCEAALRLLYYFPKETAAFIATRLHSLRPDGTGPAGGVLVRNGQMTVWENPELASGVRTDNFIKAVSWCPDPRIQSEMRCIVRRTSDPEIMAAALRGVGPSFRSALAPCIETVLESNKPSTGAEYYDAYTILTALASYWRADARPIFVSYINQSNPSRIRTVCSALEAANARWGESILAPLLVDKRDIPGDYHRLTQNGGERTVHVRVCDAAAQAISSSRPGLKFELNQPVERLDQEIASIRRRLQR